jgi:hypothetical protein
MCISTEVGKGGKAAKPASLWRVARKAAETVRTLATNRMKGIEIECSDAVHWREKAPESPLLVE